MRTPKFRWLRGIVITFLVVLVLQFELGMWLNLAPSPDVSGFSFSFVGIFQALQKYGMIGPMHAIVGTLLVLLAIVNIVLALTSRKVQVMIFGSLNFLATVMALVNGIFYTTSGFFNAGFSHGMADGFILAIIFAFIELYFLKPEAKAVIPAK